MIRRSPRILFNPGKRPTRGVSLFVYNWLRGETCRVIGTSSYAEGILMLISLGTYSPILGHSVAVPCLRRVSLPSGFNAFSLSLLLLGITPRPSARAEGSLAYNFEDYSETAGRVGVHTMGLLANQDLGNDFKLSFTAINDSIAGATPTGEPAPAGSDQVPLAILHDHRKAWDADLSRQFKRVNVAIGYADSREHDYISRGWSVNTLTDFNQKNTTLLFGVAGHDDSVETFYDPEHTYVKLHSHSAILGVTQLLDPRTTFTLNFTLARDTGYLSDQYKVVEQVVELVPGSFFSLIFPENRPSERNSGVWYASVNRAFPELKGALEGSYRFYSDTYGVRANTLELKWLQKLGGGFVLAPDFRIHEQGAAKFYYYNLDTTNIVPTYIPDPNGPAYSSDYRLSSLRAVTYGLNLSWKPKEWLKLTLDYSRYNMRGRDGVTPQSAYPDANIYSAGAQLSW